MEDNNFEILRKNFEEGTILVTDLNEEQINSLTNYYKNEIEENKNEMRQIKEKILDLKDKIDNIV